MKKQGQTLEQQIQNTRDLRQAVRLKLNEDKLQRDVYLAQHPALDRLNKSLGTMSRVLHTVTVAQQAWNIAQILYNQKGSEGIRVANDLRQAQRAYDNALKQGKSGEELANLAEDLEYAKNKSKEFNEQMKQQQIGNIINAATTFGYLATSIGSIVTKAPEMISLFRKIGGAFGGRGGAGGGFGGFGSASGPSGGGFGSAGGISGSTPTMGGIGRCQTLCSDTITKLSGGIGASVAAAIGGAIAGALAAKALENLPGGETTPNGKEKEKNEKNTLDSSEKTKNLWQEMFFKNKTASTKVIDNSKLAVNDSIAIKDSISAVKTTTNDFGSTVTGIAALLQNGWSMLQGALNKQIGTGPMVTPITGGAPVPIPPMLIRGGSNPSPAPAPIITPNMPTLPPNARVGWDYKPMKAFAAGGVINEPTLMMGMRSGGLGLMAEQGPEAITPMSAKGGGGNITVNVNIGGSVVTLDQLYETFDNKYLSRELRKRMVGK